MKKILLLTLFFAGNAHAFEVEAIKSSLERAGYTFEERTEEPMIGDDNLSAVNIYENKIILQLSADLTRRGEDEIRNRAQYIFSPLVKDTHGIRQWVNNCIYKEAEGIVLNIDDIRFGCEIDNGNLYFIADE